MDSVAAAASRSTADVVSGTAQLSQEDITAFEPSAKIGLVATIDSQGLPHVSLITSLQAKSPSELMFGQFSEGLRARATSRATPTSAFS